MSSSLPASKAHLKNAFEAIGLTTHACMLAVGFELKGLGEDHNIPSTSSSVAPKPLPEEWNAHNVYSFRYAHNQSSLQYIIKTSRLGNKAIVYGLAPGDDKTASFEVVANEYLDESKFPFEGTSSEERENEGVSAKAIEGLFRSAGRVADLGALFKTSIIQKLMPSLWKEGYEETPSREQPQRRPSPDRDPDLAYPPPARPHPFDDPLAAGLARRPWPAGEMPPPGFEDEYEMNRPPRGYMPGMGGRPHMGNIGESDLYPPGLGPRDPLRSPFGPGGVGGAGIGPGGGMHPTFDELLPGRGAQGDGWGGGHAPPGARYDPVGPGGAPRDGRGGFPGGGGIGGRPPNPFGGFGDGDFI